MICTATHEGEHIRVTFEREGHKPAVYVITDSARVVRAENTLPVSLDKLRADFRTAIAAMRAEVPST